MSELRPFALIRDGDQWVRCSHDRTHLDYDQGIVELAWTTSTLHTSGAAPALGGGLAFDNECRLYRSDPAAGVIARSRWAAQDPLAPIEAQPEPALLLAHAPTETMGDFTAASEAPPLAQPRGLAIDINDRLFIAESGADRILVYDLWSERLLRKIPLPGERPVALAAHAATIYAILAGSGTLVRLSASSGPSPCALPAGCTAPSRVAVSPSGTAAILTRAGTANAEVWFLDEARANDHFAVEFATDLAWESDSVLVVARQCGADFLRFRLGIQSRGALAPLRARSYDGLGIVAISEKIAAAASSGSGANNAAQRIGFWTGKAFRNAVPARLEYQASGRVTTFRLDSGSFQTNWGRLFLDACIPTGTEIRIDAMATDEPGADPELPRIPPANIEALTLRRPDLSPPMPSAAFAPAANGVFRLLHKRESGRELPWAQPGPDDPFETYEAPIDAPAGRYLWITLELRGNTQLTPRLKCLRAEYPSHNYLRRLPKTFSRDEANASFLRRYLAPFEGYLAEVEARAADRDVLLDPRAAPDEVLPWLASFLGLVLDERWATAPRPGGRTEDARRAIIAQAARLFRYRGTVPGLKRFVELYVGVDVILIEHYQLRGIGAAMLGAGSAAFSNSLLGFGFRVGGALGTPGESPLTGTVEDAFRTHAHRFSVIIPAALDEDQLAVVHRIIELHRPAHTIFTACTVAAGMRVGRGLHLHISSVIGATGQFSSLQLGNSALGRGAVVGRPVGGVSLGTSRIGKDSRVA
jgi:phage tail-like protein